MASFHLHIEGQVQGVGFRPYAYRLAKKLNLRGWVSNGTDGVHIAMTGTEGNIRKFYHETMSHPPLHARILRHSFEEVPDADHPDFQIVESTSDTSPNLLLTPDLGLCDACKQEILDPLNRRHNYAFTTCTDCGPRYSIIQQLPYDREYTTMRPFEQCAPCQDEYHNPENRRYFSQTNSCPSCGVELALLNNEGKLISKNQDVVISLTCTGLEHGKIVCLKGIGGYLLLADATNEEAIKTLRERKHRPAKPFAVLYPSIECIREDAHVSKEEEEALRSIEAPIVLLKWKEHHRTALCRRQISPGLNKIGVMLPYTPLLALLMDKWQKPILATSGNLSGSPIYFQDLEAITNLSAVADFFVTNNRNIVVPQDDSVLQFSPATHQRIMIRRSRGYAPTFMPHPMNGRKDTVLAMGGEMKSSFSLLRQGNVYVSQYLGDLENYHTQASYHTTLDHLLHLFNASPEKVIVDLHPAYFASAAGRKLAKNFGADVLTVQHHLAHFCAVMGENGLINNPDPVLGVVWDGTGWGDDGGVWGGEFFTYAHHHFERVDHLPYYDHLLGDKFSREPRLCALSLCKDVPQASTILKGKFTEKEWSLYTRMIAKPGPMNTSSMGRLFDAAASLLGLCDKASYEGEAAMYLEALASKGIHAVEARADQEPFSVTSLFTDLVDGILQGNSREELAFQMHVRLVDWIDEVARREQITQLAFSGGVFQNAVLVDIIKHRLNSRYTLHFHHQLSPNDECISFGQLAYDTIQLGIPERLMTRKELVTI
jgi:hydrogenase maturation protein HypF